MDALGRRFGVAGVVPDAVLPTIGSKELVAWLPTLLGLGAGDVVAIPDLAYPTYEVGALLAGATTVRVADDEPLPAGTRLVWLNSPSNPTGRVLGVEALAARVAEARSAGAVVASDECYLGLPGAGFGAGVRARPAGARRVGRRAAGGALALEDLAARRATARRSSSGTRRWSPGCSPIRKHAGMIMPAPVQEAMTAALSDDAHVAETRQRYDARRALLRPALERAGLRVDHSEAGLYLWATAGRPCRETLGWFAERGILVAPGEFYGPAGEQHVRIALTASDERIEAAEVRLRRS